MFGAMHRLTSRCVSAREAETPLANFTRTSDPKTLSSNKLAGEIYSTSPSAPLKVRPVDEGGHRVVMRQVPSESWFFINVLTGIRNLWVPDLRRSSNSISIFGTRSAVALTVAM